MLCVTFRQISIFDHCVLCGFTFSIPVCVWTRNRPERERAKCLSIRLSHSAHPHICMFVNNARATRSQVCMYVCVYIMYSVWYIMLPTIEGFLVVPKNTFSVVHASVSIDAIFDIYYSRICSVHSSLLSVNDSIISLLRFSCDCYFKFKRYTVQRSTV